MSNSMEMSLFRHYMLVRNEDEFQRDDIIRKKVYAESVERSKTVRNLIKKLTSSTTSTEKGGSGGHTSKPNNQKNSFGTTEFRVPVAKPTMPTTRQRWNLDQGKPEERHSKTTTKRGELSSAGASGLAKKFGKIEREVHDSNGQSSPSTNEKRTEGFFALSTPVAPERKTENTVLEFEENYLSNPEEALKGRNIVKKIVAVFEEKCRQSNNSKFDRASIHSEPSADVTSLASKKKRCSLQNFFGSRATRGKRETSPKSVVELSSDRYVERSTTPSFEGEDETDCEGCEDRSRMERTPKIIGAYLKKPIEVNETSIDWIPLIGKKLPRKKSFKKLLIALSARTKADSWKRKVIFASQQNLRKEVREAQDSGYDDKSSSISSSVASFTEAQQDVDEESTRKSAAFKTFQSSSSGKHEVKLYGNSVPSKKLLLLLDEVPRSELSVDLSPMSAYGPDKTLTKSLDRRTPKSVKLSPLPKHPYASSIPKHPFVSFSKENLEGNDATRIVSNGLYEVELRRPFFDQQSSEFFLENIHYDVHKCWSDPGLSDPSEEPIYDVPRPIEIPRPRSCVYQEAFAQRCRGGRTNVCFEEKSRYATVKPRNAKVSLSNEFLRSVKSESVGVYHGKGLVPTVTFDGDRAF